MKTSIMRAAGFLSVLGAVILAARAEEQTPATDRNLLSNPSFEKGPGGNVAGWDVHAWDGEVDARWSTDSPVQVNDYCVKYFSCISSS